MDQLRQISIGRTVANAVALDPKRWRGGEMSPQALPEAVARLFELLDERRIEYVLVGGIALLAYVEGRNTEDVDLIIAAADLDRMPEIAVTAREEASARGTFAGLRVDLLLTSHPLFALVAKRYATRHSFAEGSIACATVEGLVLLKLYALPALHRQRNFARVGLYENDIATLMHDYEPALDRLLGELSPHVGRGELKELGAVVADLRLRVERFKRGQNTSE
jgi:hypothetical protein